MAILTDDDGSDQLIDELGNLLTDEIPEEPAEDATLMPMGCM